MDVAKVKLAKKGDVKSFEYLINELKSYLYCVAMSWVNDEDDAGDAISETIINAYKYIRKLKKDELFKTWITRILINECKKIIKKRNNHLDFDSCNDLAEDEKTYDSDEIIDLEKAIDLLKPELKYVILFFYYYDMSLEEISSVMQIPIGTIKSRLNTAKTRLKEMLKEGDET